MTLLMSPKKRYFYSTALGFIEESSKRKSPRVRFYDTKDLALVAHYKKTHNKYDKSKQKKQEQLQVINNNINVLDAEYEYLKDMYPEEFL